MTESQNNAVMKNIHILALAFALLISPLTGYAHDKETSHVDSIAAKIQSSIHIDHEDGAEDQRIFVVFSITENGTVLVHEVGTADPEVKQSITSQFQAMQFDNTTEEYDGMYSIWLNFKTL
jgi:hypothetical protein